MMPLHADTFCLCDTGAMAGEKSPLAVDTENVKHGRLHLPIKRLIAALVAAALFLGLSWSAPDARLGKAGDSLHKARDILTRYPLVDTHVDLPILLRGAFANQLSQFNLSDKMPGVRRHLAQPEDTH